MTNPTPRHKDALGPMGPPPLLLPQLALRRIFANLCIPVLSLALPACSGSAKTVTPSVVFRDVAQNSGLHFDHWTGARGEYYYVETFASGAALVDIDGDGWLDAYLPNGASLNGSTDGLSPVNRLFRNGTAGCDSLLFRDITASSGAGHPGYGMGCVAGDYDNDGDQDLYLTNYGPNALLRNRGDGSFDDLSQRLGVDDPRWGTGSGFLDYDADGDLDLFCVNFVDFSPENNVICRRGEVRTYCDPTSYQPVGDLLYRNDGTAFTEVTTSTGVGLVARGLGVALADLDSDGDTDIYVANDGQMNFLYRNDGGLFTEVGLEWGVRFNAHGRAEASMGVDVGDYDGDGHPDIAVASFSRETNTVYRSTGLGYMADVSGALGVDDASFFGLTFGLRFLDVDNDMDLDLFAANGHVLDRIEAIDGDVTHAQPDQLLLYDDLRFSPPVPLSPGLLLPGVSRGAASGDVDNDGDLDLLVSINGGRARLLQNSGGSSRNWLLVALVGRDQRDAMGSRVEVAAGGRSQVRERQSGGSYLSSHDPRLHFGLGPYSEADVTVSWPDGTVETHLGVGANQVLTLHQGPG